MANIKYTKEFLTELVKECTSVRQLLIKLGLKEAGGNYKNIKARLEKFNIDYSHFTGPTWNTGKTWMKKKTNVEDYLTENCNYSSGNPFSTNQLRRLLLKSGKKEHKCEICNNTHWLEKSIKLELHHINGINNDNRIENLQILCPNCHSYTDNYRGKNMSAKKEIS